MFHSQRLKSLPYVIGHRGAKMHAPENTMASFELGAKLGADLLECDVHLTRDEHLVVIHDDTVDRTTNGIGPINSFNLDELKKLNAGQGSSIPTLDELLAFISSKSTLGIAIEVKPSKQKDLLVQKVIESIERFNLTERSIVISFDWDILKKIKSKSNSIATGMLYHLKLEDPIAQARVIQADALLPGLHLLSNELVVHAHQQGFGVFTWTANTPTEISFALQTNVDGIASDAPDLVFKSIL